MNTRKNVSILSVLVAVVLALALAMPASFSVARAATPTLSWVKYSGNPVVPNGFCGVAQPARPSVLVEGTSTYNMYFSGLGNGAEIYLATTSDGGITWTCANSGSPVLTLGTNGAWDDTRVMTPSVIDDGGTYKMWYTGRNADGVYGIGYATSPDGTAWTKYGSNPVFTSDPNPSAWDSSLAREPSVVKIGSTYHMWYSGAALWPYFSIGHATSPDGITWTRDASNPVLSPSAGSWDANEVYGPSVVMDGANYVMFYSGNTGGKWITGRATSSDGSTWVKDPNPILSPSATGWDNADSTDYVSGILDGSDWKVFYSGAGSTGYQIGLLTLMDQAQLSIDPLATSVLVGSDVTLNIDLTSVTNLYGYQFQVNYDPSLVSATGAFVNSFFDTTTDASVPSAWDAQCAAGVCQFAATKVDPGLPVTGSGTIAQITFHGLAKGLTSLTFSSDLLSEIGAVEITHSTTVGWIDVFGSATISGTVNLQGRATPQTAGTVTLQDYYGYSPAVVVNFSATDGTFSAVVPVGENNTYNVTVAHGLYLSNLYSSLTVNAGDSIDLGPTTLLGGDANNNGVIDIGDLTCIGGDFGSNTPGTCGGTGSSDINGDGTVNIFDLVLAGGNYDKTSPQGY